jgi:hypothetical protein
VKFCQTCLDLSNRFAAKTEQLLGATSDMAGVAGVVGKREVFEAARVEADRLRTECDILKADLKRHRSEHRTPDRDDPQYLLRVQCSAEISCDASRRLDDSILHMRSFACTGRAEAFNAALLESQSLHRECEALQSQSATPQSRTLNKSTRHCRRSYNRPIYPA